MAKISNKKKNERAARAIKKKFICFNCGEETETGHFIPPSLGEGGYFTCEKNPLDAPAKAAKLA